MATLYIAEIELLGLDAHGAEIMAPKMPPIVEQTVAIGMSSAPCTNAFTTRTRFVQIGTDAVCSIAFGVAPVATTSNQRMAANETRFVTVNSGDKIAVIANS